MTKRDAATIVICCFNSCHRDCPLFNHARICCSGDSYSVAELLRIARKEYARKSRDAKYNKEYRRLVEKEWALIGSATIL